jgi:hypothetical protein
LAAAAVAAVLIPIGGASARTADAQQVDKTSAASANSTQFQCAPAAVTPVNTDTEQTCVIAGSSGTCIEKSNSPAVVQTCTFTQAVPAAQNHRANAVQVVAVENGGVPVDTLVTQHATQIVNATQTATAGASNFLSATQVIKQSLGPGHFDDTEEAELDPDTSTHQGALALSQESHQIVNADQTADLGSNNSAISQSLKQRERAVHATVSVDENQNTMPASGQDVCPIVDDPDANMCAQVHQKSGSGPNRSVLSQGSSQFERVHDAPTGHQTQGMPTTGGMNHEVQQTSTGLCTIATAQSEHQTERAVRASVNQVQNGPLRKGVSSSQACNGNSRWSGSQDSAQLATTRPKEADVGSSVFGDPATQNDLLEYFGTTSGQMQATLSVNERVNNQSTSANTSCSGMSCEAFIACGQAFVVSEGAGGCVTTCPEGELFNPATGQCEFSDLVLRAPLSARR